MTAPAASCSLKVSGMDCASCARTVEKALRQVPGVGPVRVDVVSGRVDVALDAAVERAQLAAAIERAGYGVAPEETASPNGTVARRDTRLVLTVVSGLLWIASLGVKWLGGAETIAAALAVASMIAGGWFIVPKGYRALRSGSLDMNFLMSVAAIGALFIGEYEEAASALFLFALAQWLESRSMDRARHAITALMDLSPSEAVVLREGREVRLPADRVAVGEVVLVRPGEKIAVDGVIVSGATSVNQAPITGESVPVPKEQGSEVFAGTLNGEGVVEVRSSRPAADTTLARIIHSVQEAQASRAPSQTFVDRFARVYTPVVVGVALLVAMLPPLLGIGAWADWFYRALVLLVVACPCALVISTPVTVVSALTAAARRGILIKGGLHLENAGRATAVALDKTGTLTKGELQVVAVVAAAGASPAEVLRLAASVESRSEHAVARAVVRAAEERGLALETPSATSALPGRGVRAQLNGREVFAGNERLFADLDAPLAPDLAGAMQRAAERGATLIIVGTRISDAQPVQPAGVLSLRDALRPEAAAALRSIHAAGVSRIVMLTGDHEAAATAVAHELGPHAIDALHAGLLPDEKVAAIRTLREQGHRVLMVGDGVNDGPALAAADVSVAMGRAGTAVALEAADVALMSDDLGKLGELIHGSRRAERIIRANIAFALVTKAVFVALAVAGVATLWMAVVADMGASLMVIGNGMRALGPARTDRMGALVWATRSRADSVS